MSISVIVGPPNSGRAGAIRERLEAALTSEPVLVVPTSDDAARFERELCGDGGALLGASISTFHRLRDEVAAATGAPLRPILSDAQRLALVRNVVRDAELRLLSASARQAGFAPALERLIGSSRRGSSARMSWRGPRPSSTAASTRLRSPACTPDT